MVLSHHPQLRRRRAAVHTNAVSPPSTPTPAPSSSATTSTIPHHHQHISFPIRQREKRPTGNTTTGPSSPPPRRRDKTLPRTHKTPVDPQVANATGRNQPAAAAADPRRRRDLHAQSPNDEEALFRVPAREDARVEQDRGCGEEVAPSETRCGGGG